MASFPRWILCTVLLMLLQETTPEKALSRDKRYLLVFPRGGTFKLVVGIAVPFTFRTGQTMAIGWNFQFQYGVAQNITQLQDYPPLRQRTMEKRDVPDFGERALAYLGIERILETHGINGRACLLRSICENAMDPLYHEANGLYGHILHIALTPDYGDGEIEPELNPVYLEAQKAGKFGVDCMSLYPECPEGLGLLDMITVQDSL